MSNFIFTCPNNKYYAGRKRFDLGTIYDNMPSKADAMADIVCPAPDPESPGDPPFYPPYGQLKGVTADRPGRNDPHNACKRIILWPRVLRVGTEYTEGIDSFFVYDGREDGGDISDELPGDLKAVFSPPGITLEANTGNTSIQIREGESGSPDYIMEINGYRGSTHWLTDTAEWPDILGRILENDYARDNVPHAMGLYFSTWRWVLNCLFGPTPGGGGNASHAWLYPDEPEKSFVKGGCFFLEDLSPLFT